MGSGVDHYDGLIVIVSTIVFRACVRDTFFRTLTFVCFFRTFSSSFFLVSDATSLDFDTASFTGTGKYAFFTEHRPEEFDAELIGGLAPDSSEVVGDGHS